MAHAAKRAKTASSAKAAKSSAVSSLRRSLSSKSVKHPVGSTKAKRATAATAATPSAKRATATVTTTKSDHRGKSHGHRKYETKPYEPKKPGEKTVVTKKAAAKRPEVTRYGEAAKAKRSTSGVPRAAHKAKAAHLPHNGTAHHEQYKK